MHSRIRLKLFVSFMLLILCIGAVFSSLNAQYFGRNKVQYERFDFKVMKTEHFDIYFYPEEQTAVGIAARLAERWYARLTRILNHKLKGRQPLIIYSSQPHFQQTTAIPGILGEGTGGVTEALKRRIVLPFGASLSETDHVIGHELVHAFQYDITSVGHPRYAGAAPTASRLPLWFIEGLAEYLSVGPVDVHTSMWMRDATREEKLPPIRKLAEPRFFPYRYGQALWAYITGKWGDEVVARLMKIAGQTGDYEKTFKKVLGISAGELSKSWNLAMKKTYDPLTELTQPSEALGRVLIKGTEENMLNVSPSLSPDGKEIVFLSSRDLFSIDMFLADARTGRIKGKITKTALNPHFESLQFIRSSGSWNADGNQFVFSAISRGKPVLSFFNIKKNKKEREIPFPQLDEILNPTWSPDGRYVAFSAMVGGLSDLFIYDLDKESIRRMTEDSYADLFPAWSPDGRSIAFVTDRFSTNLSSLSFGDYQIALIDQESGQIRKIPGFDNAKNINPQWSPDSKSLYFLSDQNGITNIYRIELESGQVFQITNLYSGVSGITALSPAISASQKANRFAYCGYRDGKYTIYSLDSPQALRGDSSITHFERIRPSVLPPRKRPEGALLGLLKNPYFGLPEKTEFEFTEYKPKLSLNYLSPPQVALGVDRYGTYAGGGITLFWGDMIGYHTVATMVQSSNRLIDTAALVGYQNSRNRWNWGAVAQRIPYVIGGYSSALGEVYGIPALIEQEYLFRQINYEISGFIAYPFNRVQRFELTTGYRYIDFDKEIWTTAFSLVDNRILIDEREKLPSPPGIHFGYASAALVYDTSLFGATGPVIGQSYRLEVSPVSGSISYVSALADYRRYLVPLKPFTLAFRFLHYGRYGKDAEDNRLWPLFIGYETLVRGYNSSSFSSSEFTPGDKSFDFNRLMGSKIMVANIELRFPLFNVLGLGKGYYGIWPLDFVAFYDVGLAWLDSDKPWFLGGKRKPVSSTGIGLRINMFGYLVLGVNLVRPLSRPEKGWYFQFSFTPGF